MNDMTESTWPAGSAIQGVKFVTEIPAGERVLLELPAPIRQQAIERPGDADVDLHLLTIPIDQPDSEELERQTRAWLMPGGEAPTGYQHLTLQGAQIYWLLPRVAILASSSRLESVRLAVLEMVYIESELRSIESQLAEAWPDVEADAPLAFEFEERAIPRRNQLAARFQQVLLLRSRLAKITPRLLIPQVYPPTLASQVQERLRERLNVAHRVESLEVQLEMFERVYDGCSQRASDYILTRKGLTLEWIIVILLFLQTLLLVLEILSTSPSV